MIGPVAIGPIGHLCPMRWGPGRAPDTGARRTRAPCSFPRTSSDTSANLSEGLGEDLFRCALNDDGADGELDKGAPSGMQFRAGRTGKRRPAGPLAGFSEEETGQRLGREGAPDDRSSSPSVADERRRPAPARIH